MKKTLVVAIASAMLLTSCATATSVKIQMTGESLIESSTLFDKVSRHMTDNCIAKKYTVKTCSDFTAFSNKFKASYPAAKTIWNSAAQYEDKGLQAAATTAFNKLASDLAPFIAMMGGGK